MDLIARLREHDERVRLERERYIAERKALKDAEEEYEGAWKAVVRSLVDAEENPESTPDLSPVMSLVSVLRARGWDAWLPDMASNVSQVLHDHGQYRPGQVFFLNLLIQATKAGASIDDINAAYASYTPSKPPAFWRAKAAEDIEYFFSLRITKEENERPVREAAAAKKAQEDRLAKLRDEANKFPTIDTQLFAVYWSLKGMGPAAIRDKWNDANPKHKVGAGEKGRIYMKSAVNRGKKFIDKNQTSVSEMAMLRGLSFDG